ncbi:chromatin assembly factor 1 subunit A-domain-containing protein [Tuber brumale]|nr:chromatin assembly factor 1 subunit A-domain-containing protein [Tuber brumale]
MSNPATASTPPPPDSWRHASTNPDTPDPVKKRSLSDIGSDSPRTDGGSKLASGDGDGDGDGNAVGLGTGAVGPAKKRTKLTEAEKEAREKERLEREKERLTREKERLAKKAERDEKRRVKDEEKKKREDEKAKKEKAQMRLVSFFTKPAAGPTPQSTPPSTASTSTQIVVGSPPPPDIRLKKQGWTDYERSFQPFFVKPNVTVAPVPFERDHNYKLAIKDTLDSALSLPPSQNSNSIRDPEFCSGQSAPVEIGERLTIGRIEELMHIPQHKHGRRGKPPNYSTKDILAKINAPNSVYLNLLNSLPHKFLRFAEDVRPPYSGTYTKRPASSGLLRGRNPFQKSLPKVDYEYDSEAEWEQEGLDGDGEELLSDEEDEEDGDSGDEDLEEFLDDEEEEVASKNRRGAVSALVPICSGLCWEDFMGKTPRKEFEEMSLGILIGIYFNFPVPIFCLVAYIWLQIGYQDP